jgi:hypothetical protein
MNIKIKKTHIIYCHKLYWQSSALKITHFWKLRITFTWFNILMTLKLTVVILGTPCTRKSSSSNSPVTVPDYQLLRRWTVGWNASPQVSGAHDKWQFTLGHSHTPLKGSVNRYRHDSQQRQGEWHQRSKLKLRKKLSPFNVHGSVHLKNILLYIYIQQDATLHSLFYLETALHVLGGTTTHHQERKQLYLQHLVFVTPLMIWVCDSTLKPVPTLPR